jgi:hypothetical protein
MYKPATDVFATPKQADSLSRADALEREITDLCAQINAASYRLLQLIAVSSTLITLNTGRTAARQHSITWCYCADIIIGWCTRVVSGSNVSSEEHYNSTGRMVNLS